jgi:BASS family bile acid:Na+ symporter
MLAIWLFAHAQGEHLFQPNLAGSLPRSSGTAPTAPQFQTAASPAAPYLNNGVAVPASPTLQVFPQDPSDEGVTDTAPLFVCTLAIAGVVLMASLDKGKEQRIPLATMTASGAMEGGDGDDSAEPEEASGFMKSFGVFSSRFSLLFPIWTVLTAALALRMPSAFSWFTTTYFTGGLALLMLSTGITTTVQDFGRVFSRPGPVGVGFLLCYGMMPLLALGLAKGFGLNSAMAAGLVLVGSINGGQASNLCTYIAGGDVALSIIMTTSTTIGVLAMTPLLCSWLLGTTVPVDAIGIMKSTLQVVMAPIVVGMGLNRAFPKTVKKVEPFCPVVGIICTCLLVGSSVAQVATPILSAGAPLQWACFALHTIGGLVSYCLFKSLKFDETVSRTAAIETSMKSSAFGFLLAKLHFGEYLVRVPSAVSVVWMALCGSSMAVLFKLLSKKETS